MTEACYLAVPPDPTDEPNTERFTPTAHVGSPWGPIQHGGPVAGLLTRALDRTGARDGTRLSRVSVDLLGPVPLADVRVSARVVRPGRRIELLSAVLETRTADSRWRPAATASAWRLATRPTDDVARHADTTRTLPEVAPGLADIDIARGWDVRGFVHALEWRLAEPGGGPGEPTVAWVDLRVPLVAGEPTAPVVRAMMLADVANGVGARLDPSEFAFLNTDLTVTLFEEPHEGWYGLAAEASVGADGVGMNSAVLYGPRGPIGRVAQTLLVERHRAPVD